jgi:uncharacterized phage-associated protein
MNMKNVQMLAYLAKGHPEASVTVLIKLCYLSDLISIKRNSEKISNFNYIRYYYGPFDMEVYKDLEYLVENQILIASSEYTQKNGEAIIYKINEEKNIDIDKLTDGDCLIMDELLESVRGYGAKALTDIAYSTKPMKALKATLGGNEHLGEKLDLLAK